MATKEGGGLDPVKQFEVKELIPIEIAGLNFSFTNVSLFMVAATALVVLLMALPTGRRAHVPGRWQNLAELAYEFAANMLRSTTGPAGMKFFPLVFSLFMFILIFPLIFIERSGLHTTNHVCICENFTSLLYR